MSEVIGKTKDENYLVTYIPIRKIQVISDVKLTIDNLLFRQINFENISFNLALSPAKLLIRNLFVSSKQDFLDLDLDFEARSIKPTVMFKIHDGNITFNEKSISELLLLKDNLLEKFAIDKFEFNLNAYLSGINFGKIPFNKVILSATSNDNLINVKNFDSNIFGGKSQLSGSILLMPFTLNFVYGLNSIDISMLNNILGDGYNTGVLSANGMWATKGSTINELFYNFYVKSNILAKNIYINNFSIDQLISKINNPSFDLNNLDKEVKKSLITGQTEINEFKTNFELIKGLISMKETEFTTKFASAVASTVINLYESTIYSISSFSFLLGKSVRNAIDSYQTINLPVKVSGNMFSSKKETDILLIRNSVEKFRGIIEKKEP